MLMRLIITFVLACLSAAGAHAQGYAVKTPPTYTGTALGSGYTFAGVDTALFIANVAAYNFTLPLSISMWVKYPTLAVSGTPYLFNAQNASVNGGFAILPKVSDVNDSLLLQAYLQPLGPLPHCAGPQKLCAPVAAISDGGLHHLCAVFSVAGSNLYIDGVPRAWGPAGGTMTPNTTDPWTLGLGTPTGTTEIDVAVWNRALAPSECALIHNRGLAGVSAMSGNAPASLANNLIAWWPLSNCAGSPIVCPDSSPTNNPAIIDLASTVVITAPANGATVTGSTPITATCTDSQGVKNVAFSVDGIPVATDTTAPYTTTFNSTLLLDANNPHTVTAVCTNLAGVISTTSNSFSTGNGVIAPKTFYLNVAANGGSDANDGLGPTVSGGHGPWLTPNHAIRCGDQILAQPSLNYVAGNFALFGQAWSCPAIGSTTGPFYATLKCQLTTGIQDCYIHSTTTYGMRVNRDNWSIENWHITATNITQCIRFDAVAARSPLPTGYSLAYQFPIYNRVLNNYLDACGRGGNPGYGGDYTVFVGNIVFASAYNSAGICDSGITGFGPFDFNPTDTGTHILLAGNFIINNYDPPGCTDGEGIIFDDWNIGASIDHPLSASGSSQQALFTQNLMFGNSSFGLEINTVTQDTGGVPAQVQWSQKYLTHNTSWGNGKGLGPGASTPTKSYGQGNGEWDMLAGSSCGTGCISVIRGVGMHYNILVGTTWQGCINRVAPYTCPTFAGPFPGGFPFLTLGGACGTSTCDFANNWLWNSMLSRHTDVRLATAAALPTNTYNNGTAGVGATLTATSNGALTVDGVSVATSDRILVKNEATQSKNGIYTVTAAGSGGAPYVLTRATDANSIDTSVGVTPTSPANSAKLSYGVIVQATAGTANTGKVFQELTKGLATLGTDTITFGDSININSPRSFFNNLTAITENDPALTAPAQLATGTPGAIDCSHSMTAYACIHTAGYDTNFQPTATGTAGYGYPIPSVTCFDGSTPGYALDFTVWPVWVKGTLGSSGDFVTLPCGW